MTLKTETPIETKPESPHRLFYLVLTGVAALWLAIGSAWFSADIGALRVFAGIWLLSGFSLVSLAKLVEAVLAVVSARDNAQKARFHASTWGFLKLACMASLIWVTTRGAKLPFAPLAFGLGTLLVVPLFSAAILSLQESRRHA